MADETTKSDKDDKPKKKASSTKKAPKKASTTKKASSSTKKSSSAKKSSSKAKKSDEETVDAPAEEKPKRQRRRKPRETPDTPEPKAKADSKSKSKKDDDKKADAKSKSKKDDDKKAESKSKPKKDDGKKDAKSKSKKKDDKKRPERELPETPAKLRDAAVTMLGGLFERMELDIEPKPQKLSGKTVHIDFDGPDAGALLGLNQSSPRVLEAVQTLTRQALTDGRSMKLVLDVGGFRQKRTKRLEDVAGKLADVAAKVGQPVVVAGFNSFERKVVHQALENEKAVKTESEGHGSFRKLRLDPR